jgi:hypothetical protein
VSHHQVVRRNRSAGHMIQSCSPKTRNRSPHERQRHAGPLVPAFRVAACRLLAAAVALFGTVSSDQAIGAEKYEYKVAASRAQWVVDIDKINCLSIVDKRTEIFGQEYSGDPRIAALLHRIFPTKAIDHENPSCPFTYGAALAKYSLHAPTLGGQYPSILISVAVCERTASGEINPNRCSYKNVYLFQTEVDPFAALELGMKAYVQPQENKWEVFNIGMDTHL